jgi:carotenoid 1,2-hydratase
MPGGYAWWYIDALSDDGTRGLTLIAFIGSVFSPYYAWARRRGRRDPLNHCAINVAIYAARGGRWAMTERGAAQVHRQPGELSIGPSSMRTVGDTLDVRVDEICAPLPRRLRGSVRVMPTALCGQSFNLDDAGLHRWTPYAPCARVEVKFTEPAVEWSGVGYFDSNAGDEPLENAFESWTWSRASLTGRTVVLYDVKTRPPAHHTLAPPQHALAPAHHTLALEFGPDGAAHPIEVPPAVALPTTGWRLERATRADAGQIAHVVQTLEDAPFYSRSLLDTALLGERAPAIHESLSLNRFRSPWIQWMLPFRMPRVTF